MANEQSGERWSKPAPVPSPGTQIEEPSWQAGVDVHGNRTVKPEALEHPASASSVSQQERLQQWRDQARGIANYNSGQHGGFLQDAIYHYAERRIMALGLDKEGWEILPSQMDSPLDKIGCDLLLHNRRTGAMEMLDPTYSNLDMQTGERTDVQDYKFAKTPGIRKDGVVNALPAWFDSSGALRIDHDSVAMRFKVEDFAFEFDNQLRELTSPDKPHAFNMNEFPLPSPTIVKDQGQTVSELKAVVDWSAKKAEAAERSGDRTKPGLYREFAQTIEKGALAFSSRIDAKPLQNSVGKTAERIILDDVIKGMRPSKPNPAEVPPSRSMRQVTKDGSVVQVKPDGTMLVTLNSSDRPGQSESFNGGNVFDSFDRAARKLSSAIGNKEAQAEILDSLPKSQRKLFESGQLNMDNVLRAVARNRNEYGAGGAGQGRPLVGLLVNKYAQRSSEDLKSLVTASQANASATAHATEKTTTEQTQPAGRVATGKAGNQVLEVPPINETTVNPEANDKVKVPAKSHVQGKWADREAPTPTADSATTAKPGTFIPLTPKEVQRLDEIRAAIAKKGQLSTADQELLQTIDRAKTELSKPAEGPEAPRLAARVNSVRRALGVEGFGSIAGLAIVSSFMLQVYRDQHGLDDEHRAVFGQSW